jgi:site-specific recombinase XerD
MELTTIFQETGIAELYVKRFPNVDTQVPYRLALQRFHEFLNRTGINSLNEVTLSVAESFKSDLELDYADKTCNMTITIVKEFYSWLKARLDNENERRLSQGLVPLWLNMDIMALEATKVSSREQNTATLTELESHKLLKTAYNLPDRFQANQYKLMLLIMLNAGLRVQELTQLKLSNFSLEDGKYVINVMGKGMRKRFITLSAPVTKELMSIFDECEFGPSEHIIQGQDRAGNSDSECELTAANVCKRIKRLAKLAGIKKSISPHSLRRTCATLLYSRSVPVETIQRILGHDNPQTTQRYIDMQIDKEVSARHALDLTCEAV